MHFTHMTQSHALTLDETLTRLAAQADVDGLAIFGSRTVDPHNPVSDYDILLLVHAPDVDIFQMLTHIDGRMADLVFIETDVADRLLAQTGPIAARSPEEMLVHKMVRANITYDETGRLAEVQAQRRLEVGKWLHPPTESELYGAWFWTNHGLLHMKRMVQSDDLVYGTAVDMMLATGLGSICRTYYAVRALAWQGEKAAVRYLQAHDATFLALFQACSAATVRMRKVALYEKLVSHALAPIGPLWRPGITSVWLRADEQQSQQIEQALAYWERLVSP